MKNKNKLIAAIVAVIAIGFVALSLTGCDNGNGGKNGLSYTALDTAISNANTAKAGISVSINGADVAAAVEWVKQADMDSLNDAIATAQLAKTNSTTQAQINDAVDALNDAIDTFNDAKANGTLSITQALLDALIDQANTLKDTAVVSANGNDVHPSNDWVTQAQMTALTNAITAAQNPGSDLAAAYNALNTAMTAFETAKKAGTQSGGGDNWPSNLNGTKWAIGPYSELEFKTDGTGEHDGAVFSIVSAVENGKIDVKWVDGGSTSTFGTSYTIVGDTLTFTDGFLEQYGGFTRVTVGGGGDDNTVFRITNDYSLEIIKVTLNSGVNMERETSIPTGETEDVSFTLDTNPIGKYFQSFRVYFSDGSYVSGSYSGSTSKSIITVTVYSEGSNIYTNMDP